MGILACFLFHICLYVDFYLSDGFHFVDVFTGKMFFLDTADNLIVLFDYSLLGYVLFCCWCGSDCDGNGSVAAATGGVGDACVHVSVCVQECV